MSGRPFKRAAAALCFAALFTAAAPARALEPSSMPRETAADLVWSWMMSEMIGGVTAAWSALTSVLEEPDTPIELPDPDPEDDEGWLVDPNG